MRKITFNKIIKKYLRVRNPWTIPVFGRTIAFQDTPSPPNPGVADSRFQGIDRNQRHPSDVSRISPQFHDSIWECLPAGSRPSTTRRSNPKLRGGMSHSVDSRNTCLLPASCEDSGNKCFGKLCHWNPKFQQSFGFLPKIVMKWVSKNCWIFGGYPLARNPWRGWGSLREFRVVCFGWNRLDECTRTFCGPNRCWKTERDCFRVESLNRQESFTELSFLMLSSKILTWKVSELPYPPWALRLHQIQTTL